MDVFLGKWKLMPETRKGFEEYAEAVKIPEELRRKLRARTNLTVTVSCKGDKYTILLDYGDSQETNTFKLGETNTENSLGCEIKNCFKLEGSKLIGEHHVLGQTSTTSRWLEGDNMITEIEGNGKTMREMYKRV